MKVNTWDTLLDRSLDNCIIWENKTILVTNPCLEIVEATKNIYSMNGYRAHEVTGGHPKIFQGKETPIASRKHIKIAVEKQQPFGCDIINYCKDGKLYTCHIDGYPNFNKKGQLVNFIALENAV
jgi:hypothetical protein